MEMKQNQIFSMGQIRIWYHFSMKNEEKMSFVFFLGTFSREYSLTRAKITTIFRLSWKYFICIIKKHFKNILETSVLLWASKSCYRNWSFILNLCGVKLWCITMWCFLFLLKKARPKNKKTIVLKNMRLLIFLVFSQYGLAGKYGLIFQISIYNWAQNCIF